MVLSAQPSSNSEKRAEFHQRMFQSWQYFHILFYLSDPTLKGPFTPIYFCPDQTAGPCADEKMWSWSGSNPSMSQNCQQIAAAVERVCWRTATGTTEQQSTKDQCPQLDTNNKDCNFLQQNHCSLRAVQQQDHQPDKLQHNTRTPFVTSGQS